MTYSDFNIIPPTKKKALKAHLHPILYHTRISSSIHKSLLVQLPQSPDQCLTTDFGTTSRQLAARLYNSRTFLP